MSLSTAVIFITIVLYLFITLGVGVHFSKTNKNTDDFYLGGRKLGPLVTAMSAEASDMSSYLLMGLPGLAYLTGLCDVGWTEMPEVLRSFSISRVLGFIPRRFNIFSAPSWSRSSVS